MMITILSDSPGPAHEGEPDSRNKTQKIEANFYV